VPEGEPVWARVTVTADLTLGENGVRAVTVARFSARRVALVE